MQTVQWECQIFFIYVFCGICATLLYDVLRILRQLFGKVRKTIVFQDLIYWMLIGIGFSYLVFKYNDGKIRVFLVLEFAMGMIVTNLTISRIIVPIFIKILKIPINFLRNLVISIKLKMKSINFARSKKYGTKKARISQKKKKSENQRRKCT
jgi:hypothetical protein